MIKCLKECPTSFWSNSSDCLPANFGPDRISIWRHGLICDARCGFFFVFHEINNYWHEYVDFVWVMSQWRRCYVQWETQQETLQWYKTWMMERESDSTKEIRKKPLRPSQHTATLQDRRKLTVPVDCGTLCRSPSKYTCLRIHSHLNSTIDNFNCTNLTPDWPKIGICTRGYVDKETSSPSSSI